MDLGPSPYQRLESRQLAFVLSRPLSGFGSALVLLIAGDGVSIDCGRRHNLDTSRVPPREDTDLGSPSTVYGGRNNQTSVCSLESTQNKADWAGGGGDVTGRHDLCYQTRLTRQRRHHPGWNRGPKTRRSPGCRILAASALPLLG